MNAIYAGVRIPGVLSLKTYVAKSLGIMAMLSTGMSVGKLGPFVHIAGCVAAMMPYKQLKLNATLQHEFLFSAVAVGVIMTLATPIGGMLYAIEVSSLQCTVDNLWKAYVCMCVSIFILKTVRMYTENVIFHATAPYMYDGDLSLGLNHELILAALLGCVTGVLGSKLISF